MPRRVFFSFHYDDVVRAMNVRNSWVVRGDNEPVGFIDKAAFEVVERQGDAAIKRWIDAQMNGTSVTVVLIGTNTWSRPYVQYEIEQSLYQGKWASWRSRFTTSVTLVKGLLSPDRTHLHMHRSLVAVYLAGDARCHIEWRSMTGLTTMVETISEADRCRCARTTAVVGVWYW